MPSENYHSRFLFFQPHVIDYQTLDENSEFSRISNHPHFIFKYAKQQHHFVHLFQPTKKRVQKYGHPAKSRPPESPSKPDTDKFFRGKGYTNRKKLRVPRRLHSKAFKPNGGSKNKYLPPLERPFCHEYQVFMQSYERVRRVSNKDMTFLY